MIRPIAPEDHDLFIQYCQEFYSSEAVLHPIPVKHHENTFRELMKDNSCLMCYCFIENCADAGYALLCKGFSPEAGGPNIWLEELYIRPEFRNRGMGKAFFQFLEQQHPAARYRLELEPGNARAATLYEGLGYKTLPYTQMVKDVEYEPKVNRTPLGLCL